MARTAGCDRGRGWVVAGERGERYTLRRPAAGRHHLLREWLTAADVFHTFSAAAATVAAVAAEGVVGDLSSSRRRMKPRGTSRRWNSLWMASMSEQWDMMDNRSL